MNRIIPIRDPVHNYIPVNSIELPLVDSPNFQRLRFVLQNSSAYLTYPGNFNSRFLHSLGVMHLSGIMFTQALENANSKTLVEFLVAIEKCIRIQEVRISAGPVALQNGWAKIIGNASKFSHKPNHGSPIQFSELIGKSASKLRYSVVADDVEVVLERHPLFLINTAWEAVRLCGLIHDIGHLPMSHLFETALSELSCRVESKKLTAFLDSEFQQRIKDFKEHLGEETQLELLGSNEPLHEVRGVMLSYKFYDDDNYKKLAYGLARNIAMHNPSIHGGEGADVQVLRCLHGIVSGEVDADRLDYGLRDPLTSGVEYGAVDVSRIIGNLILVQREEGFMIVPTDKAISAIESFFHQRFLVYKYLIYHHNVVRMNAVMKEILMRFIEQALNVANQNNSFREILDRYNYYTMEENEDGYHFLPDEFSESFDDAWLRTLCGEVYRLLSRTPSYQSQQWAKELVLLIGTFLYRKSNNLFSLIKRDSDLNDIWKQVAEKLTVEPETIRNLRPLSVGRDPMKNSNLEAVIHRVQEKLEDGTILLSDISAAKIYNVKKCLLIAVGSDLRPVTEVSPYITSLAGVAEVSPDVSVAFLEEGLGNNAAKKEMLKGLFIDALAQQLKPLLI